MRLPVLVVVAQVGCGQHLAAPAMDATIAADGLAYELVLVPGEPSDRPPPVEAPVSYIDGVEATLLDRTYPSATVAVGTMHEIELRLGSVTIASRTLEIDTDGCLGRVPAATYFQQAACAYASGDLRISGEEATGPHGGCITDAPCLPPCNPTAGTGCPADQRCTSIVTSVDPLASHLGCAAVGLGQLGEPCGLISDADGVHDDCGAGLLCVAGACHETCAPRDPAACTGCEYVPGNAPELGVCPLASTRLATRRVR